MAATSSARASARSYAYSAGTTSPTRVSWGVEQHENHATVHADEVLHEDKAWEADAAYFGDADSILHAAVVCVGILEVAGLLLSRLIASGRRRLGFHALGKGYVADLLVLESLMLFILLRIWILRLGGALFALENGQLSLLMGEDDTLLRLQKYCVG